MSIWLKVTACPPFTVYMRFLTLQATGKGFSVPSDWAYWLSETSAGLDGSAFRSIEDPLTSIIEGHLSTVEDSQEILHLDGRRNSLSSRSTSSICMKCVCGI